MARPQVNTDLGAPERVQTVARPTGQQVARQTMSMSKGAQLASVLSSLKPELMNHIQDMNDDYRQREADRAYDTIQGMTYEQSQELVSSGAMRDTESPWYQAAFQKQFGLAHASKRRREIVDAYNNDFDKHGGDLDSFLAQYAQQDFEQFQDSEFIMSGVREGMAGVFSKIRDQHATFTSEETRAASVDQFGGVVRGAIDTAVEAGDNPAERVRALYADHKAAFGLTYGEMDAYVMQIAGEYAEAGDFATVEALLNHNVVGDDGTKVGSFLTRQKYADQAAALMETAKANRGKFNREANTSTLVDLKVSAQGGGLTEDDIIQLGTLRDDKQITQAAYESLLVQNQTAQRHRAGSSFVRNTKQEINSAAMDLMTEGRAYLLTDQTFVDPYTGKEHTVKADDALALVADEQLNAMAAKDAVPQVMAAQLASWGIDHTYQVWENALNNGYLTLSETLATSEGGKTEIPEAAAAGFAIYRALGDTPRLRDRHIRDQTAGAIYRDAEALVSILGWTEEDALLKAANIDRKNPRTNLSTSVERERFHSAVRRVASGAENSTQIANWIEESVRVQMDLGIGMRDAVKQGVKAYEDSHTVINGVSVNTRNIHLPPNFEELSEAALETFAEQAGEDVDDITMMPALDGSNYWTIVSRETFEPIYNTGSIPNRLHLSQLQQGHEDILAEVNEVIERNAITYEQWSAMDRSERMAAGLPVSVIGGEWHYRNRK